MKKILFLYLAAALLTACQKDDTDFSAYTSGEASTASIISITYSGTSVTVSGDTKGYVTTDGADVVVNTGTDTDKPVVAEFIGFIGATNDLTILVAVAILLRIGAEGEAQETCYCKCTKNSFNTFHFFINKFKNYLFHWQQKALPTTAISCKVIKYFTKKQIFRFFFRIFVQEKTDSNAV